MSHLISVTVLLTILILNAHGEIIVPITQTGTSNPSSTVSSIPTQPLSIKLQRKPIYAYPGIITDFILTPAIERTQDEIQNLFRFQFSDNKYLPPRIYISRGERNDQIRVMFDYQNDIPFRPFSVRFLIKDEKYSQLTPTSITLVYDSVSGGISSALQIDQDKTDYLR